MEKDGAEDLSIRRIAKELGCSSAALYRYFNSKSELMYYVSLNTLEGYIMRLNQAEKTWRGVWDIYVGVWYCYSQEAFDIQKIIIDCFLNIRMNIWVEL